MERNIPIADLTWDLDYNSLVNATLDPFLLGLNDFPPDFKIKPELLVYKKGYWSAWRALIRKS